MELLSIDSKEAKFNKMFNKMVELINKKLQKYKAFLISQDEDVRLCDLAITSVAREILYIESLKDLLDRANSIIKIFELVITLPNTDIF
jgi:hypothetical protein